MDALTLWDNHAYFQDQGLRGLPRSDKRFVASLVANSQMARWLIVPVLGVAARARLSNRDASYGDTGNLGYARSVGFAIWMSVSLHIPSSARFRSDQYYQSLQETLGKHNLVNPGQLMGML